MFIAVTIYGGGGNTDTSKEEMPFKVFAQLLRNNSFGEELKFSGTIQADNSVLLAFSLLSKVINVAIQEGLQVANRQLMTGIIGESNVNIDNKVIAMTGSFESMF